MRFFHSKVGDLLISIVQQVVTFPVCCREERDPSGAACSECQGNQSSQSFLYSFMSKLLEVLLNSKKWEGGKATGPIFLGRIIENPWKVIPLFSLVLTACATSHVKYRSAHCSLLNTTGIPGRRMRASPYLSSVSLFIFCIFCKILLEPKV